MFLPVEDVGSQIAKKLGYVKLWIQIALLLAMVTVFLSPFDDDSEYDAGSESG